MRTVRLKRRAPVFVCGKCLKRHTDGKAIRRALKAQAKAQGTKLVRTSCLGICPKQKVLVADARLLQASRCVLIDDAARVEGTLAMMRNEGAVAPDGSV